MAWPCPTCRKALATQQGMRQHHTQVHGESLPNRTCKGCSAEFYDTDAKRDYCDDCNPNAGENNGNWKGAKETTECDRCDDEFSYYPSDKEGIYCPECIGTAEELPKLGIDRYAERVTVECDQCEKDVEVLRSRTERETVRFCDRECRDEWLSENYCGEKHHSWKGGDVKYGGRWWEVRQLARERDNYTCQNCGVTEAELDQNPHVHHVEPIREFENPQNAHTLDNVVTLCPSCHHRIEHGNIPLPDGPWQ